jgi:hypothetical protein
MELVDHRVGAFERAGDGGVAGEGDAGEDVRRGFGGQAGDLDVLVAVEGEARLVGFVRAAAAGVGVGDAGLAEVGGVDGAVGIEALGEAQGDLLAGRGVAESEAVDAGEILREVEDVDAGGGLGDGFGFELGDGDDGRAGVVLSKAGWLKSSKLVRASTVSPMRKSASRMGPAAEAFQSGPVATRAVVPSWYSIWSWARRRGCLP